MDAEVFDSDRFNTKIKSTGLPGGIDPCLDEPQIFVKDRVLKTNRESENPIKPTLDRRQIFDHSAVLCRNPQARKLLELA